MRYISHMECFKTVSIMAKQGDIDMREDPVEREILEEFAWLNLRSGSRVLSSSRQSLTSLDSATEELQFYVTSAKNQKNTIASSLHIKLV